MKHKKVSFFLVSISIILLGISGSIALGASFFQYQKIQHQIQEYPHIILSPDLVQWASI